MSSSHDRPDALAWAAGAAFVLFAAVLPGPIAPMGIGTALCGVLTLALFMRRPRPVWPALPLTWGALAWTVALIVASVFALDPAGSFPRVTKGLMPLIAALAAFHARDERVGRRALAAYLATTGIVALISTLVWWGHGHGYEWRARGLSHHHMTYGGQLLLEFPVALALALTARDARWRTGAAAVALLTAIGLATTYTRSAWIGAFVSGLVIVGAVWPWGLALLALAAGAVWTFASGEFGDRLHSMVQPHQGYNGERLLMWQAGARMFRSDPLTGVGLEDLHAVYPRFKSPEATEAIGHLHNAYVQVAATMGLVGLAGFGVLLATLLRTVTAGVAWGRGLPARLRAGGLGLGVQLGVTAAVLGMMVAGAFEWNFGDEELLYHLYLLAGLAWGASHWRAPANDAAGPDVGLARWTRHWPRFRGSHRMIEPLRLWCARLYQARPDRWIVIDDFEGALRMKLDRAAYMSSITYWRGIHSYSEAAIIRRFLPEDGVFVDVGANQGELTLVAAHRARRGHVHAFEPVPQWHALLAENVALNAFPHVTLVQAALAEAEGEFEMFTTAAGGTGDFNEGLSSFHRSDIRTESVGRFPTLTLDGYAARAGFTRLDLLKIDVEGAEQAVLRGASQVLARFKPMLILELNEETFTSAGFSGASLAAHLRGLGYQLSLVDPFGRITPLAPDANRVTAFGTLFARHENHR